jgi:copper chaperone CopZ
MEFAMDTIMKIEGMHCGGCAKSVEKALGAVAGVKSVIVNLEEATASVDAENSVTLAMLKSAVEDAGYDVVG